MQAQRTWAHLRLRAVAVKLATKAAPRAGLPSWWGTARPAHSTCPQHGLTQYCLQSILCAFISHVAVSRVTLYSSHILERRCMLPLQKGCLR